MLLHYSYFCFAHLLNVIPSVFCNRQIHWTNLHPANRNAPASRGQSNKSSITNALYKYVHEWWPLDGLTFCHPVSFKQYIYF